MRDGRDSDSDVWTTGALTVTVCADDVELLKPVLPVKTAVMLWLPAVVNEVCAVAVPFTTATGPPMLVAPSLNCTEPAALDGSRFAAT